MKRRWGKTVDVYEELFLYFNLSLGYNATYPGRPGLASTKMSPFWILLELRLMEVVVTTRAILITKTKTRTKMIAIHLLKLKLELKYSRKLKLYKNNIDSWLNELKT